MQLRPYQEKAIKEILESFEKENSIMLQMPTGTGKTNVFADLVRRWIKEIAPNKRLLILVHRKELVDQIIERLLQFGVSAGRIQAGHLPNLSLRVQVGMVQSLKSPNRLPKNISLIIIDEAHHSPAVSYQNIINHYGEKVKLLGVTATPCRTNGEGFRDLFAKLILSEPIKSFIHKGYLSSIKHLATSIPDLSQVRFDNRTNDYNEKDLEIIVRNERIMADLIDSYFRYAKDKKCIVFALNRAHSIDIVRRFTEKGVPANYIDSNTPKVQRDQIVTDFKAGIYKVLSNVNIFTEGFDCPDVEVVQLARPTKSLVLYLQQVGRVMRPFENKPFGLILDNACLWKEHGLVTQHLNWSLDGGVSINREKVVKDENNEIQVETGNNNLEEIEGIELIEIDEVLNNHATVKLSINEICFLLKKETQHTQYINLLSIFKYGDHRIKIQDIDLFEDLGFAHENLLTHLLEVNREISNSIKFSKVSDFLLSYQKDLSEKEVVNRNIKFGLYKILKAIEFQQLKSFQNDKFMQVFIAQGFTEEQYETFRFKYFISAESLIKLITHINEWHEKHLDSICKKLNIKKPENQIDASKVIQVYFGFTNNTND
jgi:superfamily II DNA or RNA helicase